MKELGFRSYIRKNCIIYRFFPYVKRKSLDAYERIASFDLTKDANKTIVRLLVVNGIILLAISSLWVIGWVAVVLYSLIIYVVLRKYISALQKRYGILLNATNEIAKGNLNVSIEENLGVFEPFKPEIVKIQAGFKNAVEEEVKSQRMKSELITNVSHDIKTPIASIRAYAEGLEANMDTSPEKRAKYLNVMMKKCDEVSKFTNDLFLHSLSDLDKLKMNPEEIELSGLIDNVVEELTAKQRDVHYTKSEGAVFVMADANRLTQVLENLINNARKYAKTEIDITMAQQDGQAVICVRDHGNGIPDEDVPFIFDKFYRGKNCGDEQGSGLGLYIVKYIMEQMQGSVSLYNHDDGLEVTLSLPLLVREG